MKKMSIETIYRKRNKSQPAPGHRIYPYLLRDVAVTRPNQASAMDISYIPMARGFAYLAAVVDWFSHKILSGKLSITMDLSFCLEALDQAAASGRPWRSADQQILHQHLACSEQHAACPAHQFLVDGLQPVRLSRLRVAEGEVVLVPILEAAIEQGARLPCRPSRKPFRQRRRASCPAAVAPRAASC